MPIKCLAALLTTATLAAAPAAGAQGPDPVRITRAELFARVARTTDGLAASVLPTGPNAVAIEAHREKTGEVEVHDALEDILVAQTGRATVVVGPATGTHVISPGEHRGGTIRETHRYAMAPGDIIWIPAGLPHLMVLPKGGTVRYLALKFKATPAP